MLTESNDNKGGKRSVKNHSMSPAIRRGGGSVVSGFAEKGSGFYTPVVAGGEKEGGKKGGLHSKVTTN